MKNLLFPFVVCVCCALSASGQSLGRGSMSAQTQMLMMPEHPERALQTPMAQERNILERTQVVIGHGQRPLWEAMEAPTVTPLGDIARTLRAEHAAAKKARLVWTN